MKGSFLLFMMMWATFASFAQSPRYAGRVEAGIITSLSDYGMNQLTISTTHGVAFADGKLFTGAGVGFGFSVDEDIRQGFFPLYGDLRYTFTSLKLRPFVDVKAGYALHSFLEDVFSNASYHGGFYTSSTVGISFPLNVKNAVNVGVGYTYQCVRSESDFPAISERHYYNTGGLTVGIGIQFESPKFQR